MSCVMGALSALAMKEKGCTCSEDEFYWYPSADCRNEKHVQMALAKVRDSLLRLTPDQRAEILSQLPEHRQESK